MLALRVGPSIGAIAVGGGLTTLAVAAGMFGVFGVAGRFLDTRVFSKTTDKEMLSVLFRGAVTKDSGRLQQMGDDLAKRFDVGQPVNVFIADGVRSTMPAAAFGRSVGFHRAVTKDWTFKELEFAMAHEIAHIKAGDCARNSTAKPLIEIGMFGFAVAGLAQIFAQASLPGMVAGVGIGSAGLFVARFLVKNYERHSVERCRDVEALQKTGDLQSALSVLRNITPPEEMRKSPGILAGLFSGHPPYRGRVLNLCNAYFQAVESGAIRPAALFQDSHSTARAEFDRPLRSP